MKAQDPDDRELCRHLFAKATEVLEDALKTALEGQGVRLSARQRALAQRLSAQLARAVAISEAVAALVPRHDHRR